MTTEIGARPSPSASERETAARTRTAEWAAALPAGRLPEFVKTRLGNAGAGRTPWLATLSPAELLTSRSHGIQPITMVSGVCCHQTACLPVYTVPIGNDPIAIGWGAALGRIKDEAIACAAHAIVDVKLRRLPKLERGSMEFSLYGTAVRVAGLPATSDPVVATVSALEFVRLLELGIVPVGLAVGARFSFFTDTTPLASRSLTAQSQPNRHMREASQSWEAVRRAGWADLKRDATRQGTGVLAHTEYAELEREATGDTRCPARYFARFVVLGTVVQAQGGIGALPIVPIVDMAETPASVPSDAAAAPHPDHVPNGEA